MHICFYLNLLFYFEKYKYILKMTQFQIECLGLVQDITKWVSWKLLVKENILNNGMQWHNKHFFQCVLLIYAFISKTKRTL